MNVFQHIYVHVDGFGNSCNSFAIVISVIVLSKYTYCASWRSAGGGLQKKQIMGDIS